MKTGLIVLLILFSSCAQTEYKKDQGIYIALVRKCGTDSSCYIKEALKDVGEGRPTIYIMGLLDDDFTIIYGTYLEKEKGINVIYGGCVVSGDVYRYNYATSMCMKLMYGEDFFAKCKREVCKLHPDLKSCIVDSSSLAFQFRAYFNSQ